MDIPSVQEYIDSLSSKYIVKTSETNKGINGYVFDILIQEEINLDSEITDHYVEDNYAIQDHIAHKPVMFTVKGLVGELVNKPTTTGISLLNDIQSLASIGGFAPEFSSQATQVYTDISEAVSSVNSYINQANNLIDIFNDRTQNNKKQRQAFENFAALRESNTLCTVETPYRTYENMAIMMIKSMQREDTNLVSEFSITFKQIRIATSQFSSEKVFSGRASGAITNFVDKGQVVGEESYQSILGTVF